MAIIQKSFQNLGRRSSPWKHTPTRAIRVPQIFADSLLEIARDWDENGLLKNECTADFESLSIDEILQLQKKLEDLIKEKKENLCDRRLEEAIPAPD